MTRAGKAIHWRRSIDENAICWLTFDKAESAANTLSAATLEELAHELDDVQHADLRGLVFESAKKTGFILGADIKEFGRLRDATEAAAMAGRGQALLGRLAELGVPTVALIDGFARRHDEIVKVLELRMAMSIFERQVNEKDGAVFELELDDEALDALLEVMETLAMKARCSEKRVALFSQDR